MTIFVKPTDLHNRRLVEYLHPPGWKNPEPSARYNLVVIGAGPAGLVAAAGAAGLGARVALIERHLMGGDCLNYGCVPSKALLKAAKTASYTGTVEFPAIMKDLREKRATLAHHDSVERFTDLGVDVFLGEGHFSGKNTIEVEGTTLNFHRALIATGARAALPPIPGLEDVNPLTNETVFALTELPQSMVIVGAGPIGCEMAQAFARFGTHVTLVEMADRILPNEDPEASRVLKKALADEGIMVLTNAAVEEATLQGKTKVILVRDKDGRKAFECDEVLVSAGRKPNLESLALEKAGISFSGKGVDVNEKLQTSNSKVYAAGDVASRFQFTHSADAMARMVIENALFFGRKKTSALTVPWCTYTTPEVAHVGMTADEAKERGEEVSTYTVRMKDVDRAKLEEDTDGFGRVHIEKKTGKILGATMVSQHAGESIGEMALAITSGLKLGSVGVTLHPYPTQGEVWKKLADAAARERLTPTVANLMKKYFGLFVRGADKKAKARVAVDA